MFLSLSLNHDDLHVPKPAHPQHEQAAYISGEVTISRDGTIRPRIPEGTQEQIEYRNFEVPDEVLNILQLPSEVDLESLGEGTVFAIAALFDGDDLQFRAVPRSEQLEFFCEESK